MRQQLPGLRPPLAGAFFKAISGSILNANQQYADLGMADEAPEYAMHSVCDPELPVL
jgi:hypothetical protein